MMLTLDALLVIAVFLMLLMLDVNCAGTAFEASVEFCTNLLVSVWI